MQWADSYRSFAVETYFNTQESISFTLKPLRNPSKLNINVPLPAHRTTRRWVQNFRSTSSAKKKKPTGRPRSIRTPENIQIVKYAAYVRSNGITNTLVSVIHSFAILLSSIWYNPESFNFSFEHINSI